MNWLKDLKQFGELQSEIKKLNERVAFLERELHERNVEMMKFQRLVLQQIELVKKQVKDEVFDTLPTYVSPSPNWRHTDGD